MDRLIEASTWFAWFVAVVYSVLVVAGTLDAIVNGSKKDFRVPKIGWLFIIASACWAWIIAG